MRSGFPPIFCLSLLVFKPCAASYADDWQLSRTRLVLELTSREIGRDVARSIESRIAAAPDEFRALLAELEVELKADPMLFKRADKVAPPLSSAYEPDDLLPLDGSGLTLSRIGHRLRQPAFDALLEMDQAARHDGIVLLVSSTYRSFSYQRTVFARNVAELGAAQAQRVSAEPGRSQHQLGTAIDFGSITDAFALTAAGSWLARRCGEFGFSLSYPRGLEETTGYSWESWHFRYLGIAACRLETDYFGRIQHHLLVFLDTYFSALD